MALLLPWPKSKSLRYQMIDDVTSPIILIGAARSGTKFLRDLLKTSERVKAVPYDVNYIWRYGQSDFPHDRLDPSSATPAIKKFIHKTLPKLAGQGTGDVLLEKTVSNSLRVPFIEAVYPNARYVHLLRDGRDVTESAMRLWTAPPNWNALFLKLRTLPLSNIGYVFWFAKNFLSGLSSNRQGGKVWGPRFEGVEEMAETAPLAAVCAQQWKNSVEYATEDLRRVPPERVFEIRYEDLISDEKALRELAGFLQLSDTDKVVQAWRKNLRPTAPEQWKKLPDEDQAALMEIITPTLRERGYPVS